MANITISSTTNSIIVNFNNLHDKVGYKKLTYVKHTISEVRLSFDESFIEILTANAAIPWAISCFDSTQALRIDSVNGEVPTSNSDLFDKISALIA